MNPRLAHGISDTPAEIGATLDRGPRNRGLFFDVELLRHRGRWMRLLREVDHVIPEGTRAIRRPPNCCWILEGIVCSGIISMRPLFFTRQIYGCCRQAWLRKINRPRPTAEGTAR